MTPGDSEWKAFWEAKSAPQLSDAEFDRGAPPRDSHLESIAQEELLSFISPRKTDFVFDAGCGTGSNAIMLSPRVRKIIAMDFAEAALSRCQRRLEALQISNVNTLQGDISRTPLLSNSVDLILCMSVFHYLDDQKARAALCEFHRVLKSGGTLVLHVKNLTSSYLLTLSFAKRVLRSLGRKTTLEYFRPFSWYVAEVEKAGFILTNYNSFNLLILDRMPRALVVFLQRLELKHRNRFPLSTAFVRRLGADLKLRASTPLSQTEPKS